MFRITIERFQLKNVEGYQREVDKVDVYSQVVENLEVHKVIESVNLNSDTDVELGK